MKRALVVALVLATLVCAGTARADGDPASDYLLGQEVFLPFDIKLTPEKQREVIGLVDAANRAGFPIRVAVISSPYDLGAVTALWRKPQAYARFLGAELQFFYNKRLLIVMPNGFGLYWKGHTVASEQALLDKISIAGTPQGVVDAVEPAVVKLAAASQVKVTAPQGAKSGGSHTALIILAAVAGLAALVLLRLALRRRG